MGKARREPEARKSGQESAERAAGLLQAVRDFIKAELEARLDALDSDPWVDQASSPFGARQHCRLAREGAFPARKVGKLWLARRSALDAFIEAHPSARADAPESGAPANDTAAEVLAELGLELSPGRR